MYKITRDRTLKLTPTLHKISTEQVVIRGCIAFLGDANETGKLAVSFWVLSGNILVKFSTEECGRRGGTLLCPPVPKLEFFLPKIVEVEKNPEPYAMWEVSFDGLHFDFSEEDVPVYIRHKMQGMSPQVNPNHLSLMVYYAQIFTLLMCS